MDYTYVSNIAEHAAELAKTGRPTGHVRGRAIHTDARLKALIFPFEPGQALEEHTAPHPIVLQFLEGEAVVTVGSDVREAGPGTWIHLPAHLPHSIQARTAVVMQLLVFPDHATAAAKPGGRQARVKKQRTRNPGAWSRP